MNFYQPVGPSATRTDDRLQLPQYKQFTAITASVPQSPAVVISAAAFGISQGMLGVGDG
jgi:hypothetical protein